MVDAGQTAPLPLPPSAASRLATLLHVGEAATTFFGDLDYDRTLASIVDAVVPAFADHAFVDVAADVEDESADPAELRRAALRHSPSLPADAIPSVPVGAISPYRPTHPTAITYRTGEPYLLPDMTAVVVREGVPAPGVADAYAKAGLRAGMAVALRVGGRVIGVLTLAQSVSGRPFDAEDLRIAQHFGDRSAIAIANALAHRSTTRLAHTLQRTLLPAILRPGPGVEAASRYLAAGVGHEIGGDLLDVHPVPDGRTAFVVGDVQGRGVGAAALMGQLRVVLRTHAYDGMSPAQVLMRGHRLVAGLERTQLVTCVYGVVDPEREVIDIANAGHLPLLLVREGLESSYADLPTGVPLGTPGFEPGVTTLACARGGAVLGFTDGLVED
ncbi:MAG: hypothetical protein QOI42_1326, partial [Frankiaceae bacterium]|nr:hypothetical protein [Frankiaceae bacterium]